MKVITHSIFVLIAAAFLYSCATSENNKFNNSAVRKQIENQFIKEGLFDAWNDFSIKDNALAKSVNISDRMMKYSQWGDAKNKLALTLRDSPEYAPVWSRLAWLSLRSAHLKKTIRLAQKSNSYTNSKSLKKLNWSFMRDAYKLMKKTTELKHANQMIQKLSEGLR